MKKASFAFRVFVAVCLTLPLAEMAKADSVKRIRLSKTDVSGEWIQIAHFLHVDGDCNSVEVPLVRVFGDPKHGSVKISQEAIPAVSFKGIYAHCNGKEIPGTAAYFTSEPGFIGQDEVTLRMSSTDGIVKDYIISVDVVK